MSTSTPPPIPGEHPSPNLIGRSRELATLEERIEQARTGAGGALVVRGEPGIGKTALCTAALSDTPGVHVVRHRAAEGEQALPYSALADLVSPLSPDIDAVPEAQRKALLGALALGPPAPGDRLTVAAATLSLLAAAGEAEPRLIFLDDFHWADPASAESLLFAARRLSSDPVLFVFAARDQLPHSLWIDDLPHLWLEGLDDSAADILLARHLGTEASEVSQQVRTAAAGNPLALAEIPKQLTEAQRRGAERLPEPIRAGSRVEELFALRIADMPEPTRRALGLVAADSVSLLTVVAGGLRALGLDVSDLEPAEGEGLITRADGRIEFVHALVGIGAYSALSPDERRLTHRALAESLGRERPAERAIHLALGSEGTSETVAGEIEGAAKTVLLRGAYQSAASLLESAASLSESSAAAVPRLAAAADAAFAAGELTYAEQLLRHAAEVEPDPSARAQLEHDRGYAILWGDRAAPAKELFESEAARVAHAEPPLAASILADASLAAALMADPEEAGRLATLARGCATGASPKVAVVADAAAVIAASLAGVGHPRDLADVANRLRGLPRPDPRIEMWLAFVSYGQIWVGDTTAALATLRPLVSSARAASSPTAVPFPLAGIGKAYFLDGEPGQALGALTEAAVVADEARLFGTASIVLSFRAGVLGTLGERAAAERDAERSLVSAERSDFVSTEIYARTSLGHARLMAADHRGAVAAMGHLPELLWDERQMRHPGIEPFAHDLVEALVGLGELERATAVAEQYARLADAAGQPAARALSTRTLALVAGDDRRARNERFFEALSLHEVRPNPLETARTRLLFGERLVADDEKRLAVPMLRDALAVFVEMEARPLADRTRAALERVGEGESDTSADIALSLTPQERQVAELVVEGMTNGEVASALFVTRRTVEFHLTNVYRKLGVERRTQLGPALRRRRPPLAGPER